MPGLTIGYLEQEPQLNPEHTVRESVKRPWGLCWLPRRGWKRSTRPTAQKMPTLMRWPPNRPSWSHHCHRRYRLRAPVGDRRRRAAPAPWDAKIGLLSGGEKRRVALCRLLLQARHAVARRTHQPPGCRIRRVAGAVSATFSGTVVAITHDRYFLDNAAEWILELDRGRGIPWKGNYSAPGWSRRAKRLERRAKERRSPRQGLEEGTGMVRQNPRPPGQEQGAYRASRNSPT